MSQVSGLSILEPLAIMSDTRVLIITDQGQIDAMVSRVPCVNEFIQLGELHYKVKTVEHLANALQTEARIWVQQVMQPS